MIHHRGKGISPIEGPIKKRDNLRGVGVTVWYETDLMPVGRWSVFWGMLNNYDESKEMRETGIVFLTRRFQSAVPPPRVVVGRGC